MIATTLEAQSNLEEHKVFLEETAYLNFSHPGLQKVVAELRGKTDTQTAVNLHNFVRDEVRFGWRPAFYAMSASEVLRTGVGYCNTKSTLFVALLRGAGIPARQRFVSINADILKPFIKLRQPYVDHSYTEVLLDGRWLRVDSYIPDPDLFRLASMRLTEERSVMGYGIHRLGVNEWNGRTDAFAQFVESGMAKITNQDYGVFRDTAAFYAETERGEKLSGSRRFTLPVGIRFADAAVRRFVSKAG
ncbi:MAG: transglutaminase-like domain-containing protein [Pseudomonadota bacterium]